MRNIMIQERSSAAHDPSRAAASAERAPDPVSAAFLSYHGYTQS